MRADLALAGVCIVLAIAYFFGASHIPRLQIGDPLGPRAFPELLGAILLFGAALLVWETLAKRRSDPRETAEDAKAWTIEPMVPITLLAMIPLAYFLETLGYVICSTIFLTLLTTLLRRDRFWSNLLWSAVFTLVLYFFMARILGAGLPQGLLPF